jgi:hypothetical protein
MSRDSLEPLSHGLSHDCALYSRGRDPIELSSEGGKCSISAHDTDRAIFPWSRPPAHSPRSRMEAIGRRRDVGRRLVIHQPLGKR